MLLYYFSFILLFIAQETTATQQETSSWYGDIAKAFAGAIIALVVTRFMKAYDDNDKLRDIRRLIHTDLSHQIEELKGLKDNIDKLAPILLKTPVEISESPRLHDQLLSYRLHTDTYKSQTKIDLYKAFSHDDFSRVTNVYHSIAFYEKYNLLEVFNDFRDRYVKFYNEPRTTEQHLTGFIDAEKDYFDLTSADLAAIIKDIEKILMNHYLKYKTSFLAEFLPVNAIKSTIKTIITFIILFITLFLFMVLATTEGDKVDFKKVFNIEQK